MTVATGLQTLLASRMDLVRGRRVGLVTNPTAVLPGLAHISDVFWEHPDVDLRAMFGPEHGVSGSAMNGAGVESGRDVRTGLPVYSLYGEQVKPTPEQVADLDVVVFDIQDVGARFYTYVTTMGYCLEAAAEAQVPMLILDRPNPITGLRVEGPVLDRRFASYVGRYPVPIRHGMTVGELGRMVNDAFGVGAELTVVPMQGWDRGAWFDQTGLHWVSPSPNLATLDTATVYPGTCLIEGTSVSEGRGTVRPFEWVGAPWIDGWECAHTLNRLELAGARFRPVSFVPAAGKYAGQLCGGIQVHVLDRQQFLPVTAALYLVTTLRRTYPDEFGWRSPREGEAMLPFDRLMGTDTVRQQIEDGWSVDEIVADWEPGVFEFRQFARQYHIYP